MNYIRHAFAFFGDLDSIFNLIPAIWQVNT